MLEAKNATVLYIQNESTCSIKTISFLKTLNLKVVCTSCYSEACDLFSHHKIDVILIDLNLDREFGLDFLQCLRQKNILTPTILTTTDLHRTPLLKVLNLEISSCLVHPYQPEELRLALEKAVSRQIITHPLTFTDMNIGFKYDPLNKEMISSDKTIIKLSKKEAMLIDLLLQNSNHITSYEMIETVVWQEDYMSIDALRTLIRGIRKKTHPNIITNHNGIGYKIDL